jgi:hypothetical protein
MTRLWFAALPLGGSQEHPKAKGVEVTDTVADGAVASEPGLAERDQLILAFERQWWKYAGAKEQAIRDQFGMSATRYYQILNALIDRPEALAKDPLLVKRLRRLRSSRQRARSVRRHGTST